MSTVKRKASGAIVLKDGKVSCSCCAQPPRCCMYPAVAFGEYTFSHPDLPDTLIVGNSTFYKVGADQAPVFYSDLTGYDESYIALANQWILYGGIANFEGFYSDCLVGEYILPPYPGGPVLPPISSEDQFQATYNAQGLVYLSTIGFINYDVVVNRTSLCVWESNWVNRSEARYMIALVYEEIYNKWVLRAFGESPDGNSDEFCIKDQYQNTPVGSYLVVSDMSGTIS